MASFHKDKFRPKGQPNGGDGGHGGSIVLEAAEGMGSLSAYSRRRLYEAKDGGQGGTNNRRGADASDLVLPVPAGTVVRDVQSKEVLADLAKPGTRYVVARGGQGGRGNVSISSGVERNPSFAERGEPGVHVELQLELRLVADAGLLGPPNAGKSTLLGGISRARPKVGDYPFTTLDPSLGVVEAGEDRLVVADLPGLIEGAAEGRGLGLRFLRHAERCSVLALVVDCSGPDVASDLETTFGEAEAYEVPMGDRVRIVIGNKLDLPGASEDVARAWAKERSMRFVGVSALEGKNLERLITVLADEIATARRERGRPESYAVFRPVTADRVTVSKDADGYRVSSERAERLVAMTPLGNPRAVRHLQRRLKAMGVETALAREGAKRGDEIHIGSVSFEFHPEEGDE